MELTFIGDIHGEGLKQRDWYMPCHSVQVGDFDMTGYKRWNACASDWALDGAPRFFIDGNHDNFQVLNCDAPRPYSVQKNLYHIPRGFVSGKVLFIGGAESIDKDRRIAGRDWYSAESITQQQFERACNAVEAAGGVEVIVSHDCPITARVGLYGIHECNPSAVALEHLLQVYKPKLWIFGHHHKPKTVDIDGCKFVCLNIGERKKFDVPVEYDWGVENNLDRNDVDDSDG